MFEAAELGHKLSKPEFKALEASLRIELTQLQQQLRQADFPVIVVISGVDGAGKVAHAHASTSAAPFTAR